MSLAENAGFILMLLLEIYRDSSCDSLIASNRELLPAEYHSLTITQQDHKEIVTAICALLRNSPHARLGSLIHLLSKGSPEVIFEPLITAIHGISFDEETAIQAVFALYDLASRDPYGDLFPKHAELLRRCEIMTFLLKWDTTSVNERVDVKYCISHVQRALTRT